jgi:hypothetical protein
MRLLLRPSEVLGAIVADDSLPTVAVRRLLLLGCTVELDGNGEDSIVCGPTTVSRPVVFKPCGAAPVRTAFHAALLAARGPLPPPSLALVTTTSSLPRPTPCLITFASNKHRAVIVVQPVVALGLEGREAAGEGGGDDATAAAAAEAPLVRLALPASSKAPALILKVGKTCALRGVGAEHASGAMEVAPVRTIFRVSALLGLITYKSQGKSQRLRARAVDLGDAAHVELLFNGLGAAGAPLPAAPLASHATLRAQLVGLQELLARPPSAALPALTPGPLQALAGAAGGEGAAEEAAAGGEAAADGGGGGGGGGDGSPAPLPRAPEEEPPAPPPPEAEERAEGVEEEEEEEEEDGEEHAEAWPEGAEA